MSDKRRCRRLIENILDIKIRRIEYPERQKTMDFSYDAKSVRLDIYVEDEKNTVYNIEMQTNSDRNLAKRIRYYHDMIDLNIIDKGDDYRELKKSFVIFICTFDPFDKDRYIYTFERQCREDQSLFLKDDTVSVILNCCGHNGVISDELKGLLRYMSGQKPQGSLANDIAEGVSEVHSSTKWRRDYMTLNMLLREERMEGIMQGRQEGLMEGRQEGRQEGQKVGELCKVITSVKNGRGKIGDDMLRSILGIDPDLFRDISALIDRSPDSTDEDIAEELLGDCHSES